MLAIHQDQQEKAYKEIYDIFGDSDRDIEQDDLQNLRFLEMVIKETLRLFPPIPLFQRESAVDLQIGKIYYYSRGLKAAKWVATRTS